MSEEFVGNMSAYPRASAILVDKIWRLVTLGFGPLRVKAGVQNPAFDGRLTPIPVIGVLPSPARKQT